MPSNYLAAKYGTDIDRAAPVPIVTNGGANDGWASILGLTQPDRLYVSEDNVQGIPALDRAVELVSNAVATMMHVGTRESEHAVLRRPHPLFGAFEYYAMICRTAMMRGNSIHIPVGEGDDMQLVPVNPDAISVDESSGLPVYTINDMMYRYDEVLHFRANAVPGTFMGRGIVEKFRTALSGQLYGQKYEESTHSSGGVPSGVVTIDQTGPVTQDQTDTVDESWQSKFGKGNRKVAVLPKGLSFQPVSWSPHDVMWAEARRISAAEAALMAGLRPEDLGASYGGSGLTYANRSDDNLQRLVDSYQPWVELLEAPLSDLTGSEVAANPEALLRLTPVQTEELEALRLDNETKRRALNEPDPAVEVDQ